MKLVIAHIKPFKLENIREALALLDIKGTTVTEIKEYGKTSGHTELYRGSEYIVEFIVKTKIEIAIPDQKLNEVLDTIREITNTGDQDDGTIHVLNLEQAIRIRTGDVAEEAL